MKSVSVVIAIKGKENFDLLTRCINSLFAQSVLPEEIIVVGEREDIEKLEPKTKGKVSFKKIYASADKNEARNIGIAAATGDYVLYLDHDMAADKKLIENCLNKTPDFDAVIIPEKGAGGNFWENCKKLEKELITYDFHTVTPRFYRRLLFKGGEKPFDEKFGLLDEWGFNHKLMTKNVKVGYSDSFVVVKERNFSIPKEALNKFKRGLWMKNFYKIDKEEAWERVNPIKRGIIFYGKKVNYLWKEPALFTGLLVLKTIDFASFFSGYLLGSMSNKSRLFFNKERVMQLYNNLGNKYLDEMFKGGKWNRYVDKKEKEAVIKLWNLEKDDGIKDESVLDLGMGPGRWSNVFIKSGFKEVTGVDISPVMIECAQKNIQNNRFSAVLATMEKLPFENGRFDRVFSFRAFKYVPNQKSALSEVERVLKPSGSFMLEVSNKSILNMLLKTLSKIVLGARQDNPESRWQYFKNVRFYSREELIKFIGSTSSFNIIKLAPIFILPSIKLPQMLDRYGYPFLVFLDMLLFKVLPKTIFARSWIVVAVKKQAIKEQLLK